MERTAIAASHVLRWHQNMNNMKKSKRWRILGWSAIVVGILVTVLAALSSFNDSRNTASRDACLHNLRLIEEMKKAEQTAPMFEPVKILSATSALSPEFRSETTNANKTPEHISEGRGRPSENAQR